MHLASQICNSQHIIIIFKGQTDHEVQLHAVPAGLKGRAHSVHQILLGDAGVDRRLIDHDVAFRDDAAHRFGGAPEGLEVGTVVVVDGGGDGDNVEVGVADIVKVGGAAETVIAEGVLEELVADLEGGVVAGVEGVDALAVQVVADCRELCGKQAGEGQADVAQTNHANFYVFIHYLTDY